MTFTEKYRLKLDRENSRQADIQARKEQKKQERLKAAASKRGNSLKEQFREARGQLLRIQGYSCGICKRRNNACGKAKLRADSHGSLIRGLLCQRCNRLLSRHGDNPLAITFAFTLDPILRRNAVNYLENWPSSKMETMYSSQGVDLLAA